MPLGVPSNSSSSIHRSVRVTTIIYDWKQLNNVLLPFLFMVMVVIDEHCDAVSREARTLLHHEHETKTD